MAITSDLKQAICSLFEVHADECGVQRIVTPLEYPGSNDQIIIRVRPSGNGFAIDENGETSLYASLNGGDIESEARGRGEPRDGGGRGSRRDPLPLLLGPVRAVAVDDGE